MKTESETGYQWVVMTDAMMRLCGRDFDQALPDHPQLPSVAERLAEHPRLVPVLLEPEWWELIATALEGGGTGMRRTLALSIREQIGAEATDGE